MRDDLNEGWYVIARPDEVGSRLPAVLERFGRPLVLWRSPAGAVMGQAHHPGLYDERGALRSTEERRASEALVLREAHGWIWTWLGAPREQHPPIAPPPGTEPGDHHSTTSQIWSVPFADAVRAQLAAFTEPTVPPTVAAQIDGNRTRAELSSAASDAAGPLAHGALVAANLWVRTRGDKASTVAAFVPIDEHRTEVYTRTHQRMVTIPGVSWLWSTVLHRFGRDVVEPERRGAGAERPMGEPLNA